MQALHYSHKGHPGAATLPTHMQPPPHVEVEPHHWSFRFWFQRTNAKFRLPGPHSVTVTITSLCTGHPPNSFSILKSFVLPSFICGTSKELQASLQTSGWSVLIFSHFKTSALHLKTSPHEPAHKNVPAQGASYLPTLGVPYTFFAVFAQRDN
jgi:hypothetical protein